MSSSEAVKFDINFHTKCCIKEFLERLEQTCSIKRDFTVWQSHVSLFYRDVYQMIRLMHLNPNFCDLLTDENKKTFTENFMRAFIPVCNCTFLTINNITCKELNKVKTKLTELNFLKNEVFNLYKELNGGCVEMTDKLNYALEQLNVCIEILQEKLEIHADHDENELRSVPNLNGVPESHIWWTPEERNSAKDKTFEIIF